GVLIISGVHRDADIESIFLGISPPLTSMEKKSIILEKRSSSTVENAVEVRRIMEEFGLGSMVLITSNYHMRRAAYTFTTVMPEAVEIKLHAVRSPNFDPSRWWSGRGLWITLSEFVKYRLAVLRFRLGDPAR
ncbi:MAG TPA: YdcF family protein, partial [Deltaproteobacteria bacterium]|nr:YdcF family protein [Deltaproteobacteria bacterium]